MTGVWTPGEGGPTKFRFSSLEDFQTGADLSEVEHDSFTLEVQFDYLRHHPSVQEAPFHSDHLVRPFEKKVDWTPRVHPDTDPQPDTGAG